MAPGGNEAAAGDGDDQVRDPARVDDLLSELTGRVAEAFPGEDLAVGSGGGVGAGGGTHGFLLSGVLESRVSPSGGCVRARTGNKTVTWADARRAGWMAGFWTRS